jgi:hypothetical protein
MGEWYSLSAGIYDAIFIKSYDFKVVVNEQKRGR